MAVAVTGGAAGEDMAALKKRLLPGIKGEDNRQIVDSIDYPWSAIGRVNTRIGGFCTGTVIGPPRIAAVQSSNPVMSMAVVVRAS